MRTAKLAEMRHWALDIDSYYRMKKLRDINIHSERIVDFCEKRMQMIRDRWPNVKNWE